MTHLFNNRLASATKNLKLLACGVIENLKAVHRSDLTPTKIQP
jgi:hypothetical protein